MFHLISKFENKNQCLVFAMIIYGNIKEFIKCRPGGESNLEHRLLMRDCQ